MTQQAGQHRPRIGARRTRMSEAQTRETALRTAVAAIQEDGLSVSLEHLSMEDVIREAGVSRTTFYRLWPLKEQFIGDLIVELAKQAIPTQNTRGADATGHLQALLLPQLAHLQDDQTRRQLARQLVATAVVPDFAHTASLTAQWRTYFALVTTVMNLPAGEAKDAALTQIGQSEARYRARLVGNFTLLMNLFGMRLRERSGATLDDVADLVIALVRGLVLRNQMTEPPSGTLIALGSDAILAHCVEDDPSVVWDQTRIGHLEQMLTSTDDIFAPPSQAAE